MSILRARNKKPIVNFGNGVVEATINVGTGSVVVTLINVYNSNFYETSIIEPSGVDSVKINDSNFELTADVVGTYDIQLVVTNIATSIELKSNTIKLIVI